MTDVIFEGGMASCNAIVIGAVLGCQTGYKMLPKKWIDGLPQMHKDWLNSKLNCLLNIMGLP
jgi:ADP-ribosylglycohydrolase